MSPLAQSTPPPAAGRLAAAFVSAFLKDATKVSGDFIDTAICLAVIDANVRHLMADPALAGRYATHDDIPPDDQRRPVSINAISASLGLAFETTRRRVHRLQERGLLKAQAGGLIMSRAQLSTPAIRMVTERAYASLQQLYARLRTEAPGLQLVAEGLVEPVATHATAEIPFRAALRATQNYVLRYLESSEPVAGDLVNAILLLFITNANTAGISYEPDPAAGPIGLLMPDDLRRRVSMQSLAKGSGLAFETTRRRVAALIEAGICQRDSKGIYVPAAVFLSPPLVAHRDANAVALQRLFTSLARMGVRFEN